MLEEGEGIGRDSGVNVGDEREKFDSTMSPSFGEEFILYQRVIDIGASEGGEGDEVAIRGVPPPPEVDGRGVPMG